MIQTALGKKKGWFVSLSALFSGQECPSTFSQAIGEMGQCQTGLLATSKQSEMLQKLLL